MLQEPNDFPPRSPGPVPWWVVWLLLIALAALCGFMGAALSAEQPAPPAPPLPGVECMARETAMEAAKRLWSETPVFVGPANTGAAMVLTLNPVKKSWTAFACTAERCCVLASGQNATFLPGA